MAQSVLAQACRRLGLSKWPYQHTGPRRRRKFASELQENSELRELDRVLKEVFHTFLPEESAAQDTSEVRECFTHWHQGSTLSAKALQDFFTAMQCMRSASPLARQEGGTDKVPTVSTHGESRYARRGLPRFHACDPPSRLHFLVIVMERVFLSWAGIEGRAGVEEKCVGCAARGRAGI